jgi:hypothetical protein
VPDWKVALFKPPFFALLHDGSGSTCVASTSFEQVR